MYKTSKALLTITLATATFVGGSSLASMQERSNTNNQTNQNNSRQNGNTNRSGNMNRNMNGNMSGNMMNSNMGGSGGNMMNSGSNSGMMMTTSTGMIGGLSVEEFNRLNAQGSAAVAAITPTSAPLSRDDQKLMMEVAMGGMMQLQVSQVALQKATSQEARLLAQSEVEEQTGVSAKLREIAAAKGVTLPMAPDSKTQSMVAKMQRATAGMEFDRMYVRESGVKGHEKLEKTMTKVQSKGSDPALTALATATMPVIRTHLQVSRQVVNGMSGTRAMSAGSN